MQDQAAVRVLLDDLGEFGERRRDAPVGARIDPEFIVASPHGLYERVAVHDHAGGAIAFEAAHRTEPKLEPPSDLLRCG